MPKLGLIIWLNWGILQATGRPETMSTRELRGLKCYVVWTCVCGIIRGWVCACHQNITIPHLFFFCRTAECLAPFCHGSVGFGNGEKHGQLVISLPTGCRNHTALVYRTRRKDTKISSFRILMSLKSSYLMRLNSVISLSSLCVRWEQQGTMVLGLGRLWWERLARDTSECVWVCVCVSERERERERGQDGSAH